jgi:hypothetical protein
MSCTEVEAPRPALFLDAYRPWMTLLNVRLRASSARQAKEASLAGSPPLCLCCRPFLPVLLA